MRPKRQLLGLSQEKVAAFADLFLSYFFFFYFFLLFILLFSLFSYFYHTALLAALFMRKVAQSTCKIKIIISSCWATAIICAPCAVHITQPGERGEREKGKMQMQRNFMRLFLCVCLCVCVVALLSMLQAVQLSWQNLIKGKKSNWKSKQNYLSFAAVLLRTFRWPSTK